MDNEISPAPMPGRAKGNSDDENAPHAASEDNQVVAVRPQTPRLSFRDLATIEMGDVVRDLLWRDLAVVAMRAQAAYQVPEVPLIARNGQPFRAAPEATRYARDLSAMALALARLSDKQVIAAANQSRDPDNVLLAEYDAMFDAAVGFRKAESQAPLPPPHAAFGRQLTPDERRAENLRNGHHPNMDVVNRIYALFEADGGGSDTDAGEDSEDGDHAAADAPDAAR